MKSSHETLKIESLVFYSNLDEGQFFSWLQALNCVKSVNGVGRTVGVVIDRSLVDEESLRELLAVFFRYGVPMSQLGVFESSENRQWFRNREAYWYRHVFGSA
jgi:hypothetical protein